MNCDEFERKLHQDVLTEQEKNEMESHMAGCAVCRLKADLKSLMPDEDLPASAAASWREAVRTEAQGKKIRKFPVWARYASLAASLVLLVIGASRVGQMNLTGSHEKQAAFLTAKRNTAEPAYAFAGSYSDYGQEADAAEAPAEAPMLYSMEEAETEEEAFELDDVFEKRAANGPVSPANQDREEKIIRNAVMMISTQDFDADLLSIRNEVARQNGQISSSGTEQTPAGSRRASLSVRIPAESLDPFLENIGSLSGRIIRKEINSENVTEPYYDIRARLDNAVIRRDRLRELARKTENVNDLLQIENSLSDAQSSVDYLTGRISSLEDSVSYSAVSITLTEETPAQSVAQTDGSFLNRLRNGMTLSFRTVWQFLQNMCLFLLMSLPWLAALAAVIFAILFVIRKKRRMNS